MKKEKYFELKFELDWELSNKWNNVKDYIEFDIETYLIGIISPVNLLFKIPLNTPWKDSCFWDSEVNEVVKKKFLNWYNELFISKEIYNF